MKTVVVATDGSAGSARAFVWGKALAAAFGADVKTVPVCGPQSVLAAAERLDCDLIVVPSHPRGVAEYVARHARRPFAVVPSAAKCRPPARIAVGDDGSAGADQAAKWSMEVAEATEADIVAIDIVHPPEFLAKFLPDLHDDVVHDLEAHWAEHGHVAVTTEVLDDEHPASALLAAAQAEDAELLVLGARALCGVRLLPEHGVTLTAVHHARVPVVVVPAEATVVTTRDGGWEEGFTVERVLA